jgi:hypothetical protein
MFEAATDPTRIAILIGGMQSVKKKHQANHWNQSDVERYVPRKS